MSRHRGEGVLSPKSAWRRSLMLSAVATNLPCGQKSVPTPSKSIRAGYLSLRADKNRFVRPFFPPCDENSICAGTLAFRASQLPVRAGKNPSVRPFFDLCRQKPRFLTVLANGDGQKGTVALLRRMCEGREGPTLAHRRDIIWHFGRTARTSAATSPRRRFNYENTKRVKILLATS